jgi:hypothetical protein
LALEAMNKFGPRRFAVWRDYSYISDGAQCRQR